MAEAANEQQFYQSGGMSNSQSRRKMPEQDDISEIDMNSDTRSHNQQRSGSLRKNNLMGTNHSDMYNKTSNSMSNNLRQYEHQEST